MKTKVVKHENNYLDYATDIRKSRRKGAGGTQEFFSPAELVSRMCDKIDDADWADATKTFLEPCAGNGNFVVEIIKRRIAHGVSWQQTLNTLFTVELMQDNVDEMKTRILQLLHNLSDDVDDAVAKEIMDKNCVCSDFFKWDFENWQPITD